MTAPRWKHDCTDCTYLGAYENADLYRCMECSLAALIPVLIARIGDACLDYMTISAIVFPAHAELVRASSPALFKAYELAQARRLI